MRACDGVRGACGGQGGLPPELGLLASVEDLRLSRNALSGPLPSAALLALPALRRLRLDRNLLSGPLPPAFLARIRHRAAPACQALAARMRHALGDWGRPGVRARPGWRAGLQGDRESVKCGGPAASSQQPATASSKQQAASSKQPAAASSSQQQPAAASSSQQQPAAASSSQQPAASSQQAEGSK